MRALTSWLREYLPGLAASDRQLADDLTLRGIAVDGVFDLKNAADADLGTNGSLFEMDITTNRVDAMNHYGIAREAATIYGLKLNPLDASLPAAKPGPGWAVRIEEPALCGRFTARVLRGIKVEPSTGAVADRFRLLEQKQISNAVDATNYIVLAMGHPTHAFDLDKLEGAIVIRRARKGERLKTLDEIERVLDPEDLIVADEKKPLALAGVMGGWDSRITADTTNVLVEAAWFDPASIRRSSKRHLIHTDASHRFERGADFNAPPLASALVSQILLESGGEQVGEFVDVVIPEAAARTASRSSISFALSETHRILGATEDPEGITAATAETILTSLGCSLRRKLEARANQTYQVTLPSWRLDLEREIDLIEEVARVYGYNRFQNTLPAFAGSVVELPWAAKEAVVRQALLALGWTEAISSTFCAAADAALFEPQPDSAVAIGNPLSEEAGMLRPSLLPGMVGMLALNLNRDVEDAALFEAGTVFSGSPDRVDERPALAIGATGRAFGDKAADFYDLKGTVEALLAKFSSRSVYFDKLLLPAWLHPGRGARAVLDGSTIAYFGQLAERRKLKQIVFVGEIYLDRLYRQPLLAPAVRELSRYQPVRRDFSLLFPDATSWATIEEALGGLNIAELRSFAPREILRGVKAVPSGHFSLLLGTVFQSQERTLREEELQEFSQKIVAAMETIGGKLRTS